MTLQLTLGHAKGMCVLPERPRAHPHEAQLHHPATSEGSRGVLAGEAEAGEGKKGTRRTGKENRGFP